MSDLPRFMPEAKATRMMVKMAPAKAQMLMAPRPAAEKERPPMMAKVAPSAAPEETPIICGSAMGLWKSPW